MTSVGWLRNVAFVKAQKPKNPAAVALRALANPTNMKRTPTMARKAANARWDKWYENRGLIRPEKQAI